mmetsp:Transcript_18497/g.44628  ORF Transcript_18497/g.44628 Transcript_18497/m.44628 type:complete len:177 (-) Transcript_18497:315-845(-)
MDNNIFSVPFLFLLAHSLCVVNQSIDRSISRSVETQLKNQKEQGAGTSFISNRGKTTAQETIKSRKSSSNHIHLSVMASFHLKLCGGHFDQGGGQGLLGEVITSGVKLRLGDGDGLDDVVVDDHGKTLAPADDTDRGRTFMGHLQVEGLGEGTRWVTHHGNDGSGSSLVSFPSLLS